MASAKAPAGAKLRLVAAPAADAGRREKPTPARTRPASIAAAAVRHDETASAPSLSEIDRFALVTLERALLNARQRGDRRPPFTVVAASLDDLGAALPERTGRAVSLEQAQEQWLERLRNAGRSPSTLAAYRVALDDLRAFLERAGLDQRVLREDTIVAHLSDYRRHAQPAPATYYRRFALLRRFFRWLSRRSGTPDPFVDLEPPAKPQQEADWLTAPEFQRLLDAAGAPLRRRVGLAARDRLVLLTLVSTGLRRSELLALDWSDLDLDNDRPSLLVRCGKGGKPRRQPLPTGLANELALRRAALAPAGHDPVFCGLEGKRLQRTLLGLIIRRAAERAGLDKHVTAHTLRHTAATWLRQQTGDARLVAAYLGHADLSTVSRYAHVAPDELHLAAATIAAASAASSPHGFNGSRCPDRLVERGGSLGVAALELEQQLGRHESVAGPEARGVSRSPRARYSDQGKSLTTRSA